MAQYKGIKAEYQDAVLFFRLGDFYEMFFGDAEIVSRELGLTLTSRNREKGQEIPMAGIPYHSSASYIARLIEKGYSVAICEQVQDPKDAVGIVERKVVRVVTPGTVIDTDYLDEKSNNYLMGIKIHDEDVGISYMDITTGEFLASEVKLVSLMGEINKISPKEIVTDSKSLEIVKKILKNNTVYGNIALREIDAPKRAEEYLQKFLGVVSLESFNLRKREFAIYASALTLKYALEQQKGRDLPIGKIEYQNSEEIVELNYTTQKNLEIVENSRDRSSYGTLFWVLDRCKTSMGSRSLKKIIKNPLKNRDEIVSRQNHVEFFIKNPLLREEILEKLKNIYDIERILGKMVMGTENGKDIVALKKSLKTAVEISELLDGNSLFSIDVENCKGIYYMIDSIIVEDPPFSIREGGIIKRGVASDLDELHDISTNGKDRILSIENRERERTGIKTLKIKFNKVFGYFIEITNSNRDSVPADYIRKQTLSNAERYIVPDLKDYEEKVLHAKERIEAREYSIFKELTSAIKAYQETLQDTAMKLSYLDVITSFAEIAIKNNYVKPEIGSGFQLQIIGGRHPVVEALIKKSEFVKNDLFLDEKENIIVLTGPNMSGKSTYMKQCALILVMAHIGCYIPADYGNIPLTDKIFTRIGASDDLLTGQSTFMLEMSEMANILNSATENSFIILDEIGRGTSTFDGISIATSITEYIHDKIGAKTIFATHYHEMTQLEKELKGVVNFRIEVKEEKEIVFLRKIVKGGADKSYGIEVARLAGLPKELLKRSKEILSILENQREIIEIKTGMEQLNLFGASSFEEPEDRECEKVIKRDTDRELVKAEEIVLAKIGELDINSLTPMEAFMKLNELKNILG
ncbi:MAG: DNA mismatch repair protein MutS [Fusobacteriaceae bacterium]